MKKLLIALVVLCATFTTATAQLKFGVRAGYNLTNATGGLSADNKSGFYAGPTIKFSVPITGLTFDISAVYDQRSTEIDGVNVTSKQIAIPVNARYGVGLGSMANIFAFAGPQFGFNVGNDLKDIKGSAADWTWKKSNFSVNLGIGATIKHVEIKANYNLALGKTGEVNALDATKAAAEGITGKANYNAWQLGLAYYF